MLNITRQMLSMFVHFRLYRVPQFVQCHGLLTQNQKSVIKFQKYVLMKHGRINIHGMCANNCCIVYRLGLPQNFRLIALSYKSLE